MDMRSKDILKNAIMKYDGTVVVVSHDHRLVEENGFRCLRLDVDGGDGSINTTLRG